VGGEDSQSISLASPIVKGCRSLGPPTRYDESMAVLRPWDDRPSESSSDSADAAAADLAKRRADVTAQEHPGPSADAARLEAYKAAPDVALGETLDSRPRAVPSPNVALGETLDSDPSHPSQRPAASRVSLGSSAFPVENWARYEFIKLLGQGGMGAVYQAKDKQLGRIVALKFIRGGDPNLVMRFVQEARAQSRIEHPGICKVYEVGEVEGKAYIAMQYVPGQPLGEAAASMTQTEKVQVMSRVARALSAAHQLGIIHRDIKPHEAGKTVQRQWKVLSAQSAGCFGNEARDLLSPLQQELTASCSGSRIGG
jgi:hypothetical protein